MDYPRKNGGHDNMCKGKEERVKEENEKGDYSMQHSIKP